MSFSGMGSAIMYQISQYGNDASSLINAQMSLNNTNIRVEEMQLSMAAESEKAEWNKWKIIQDTQNKIYEIQQGVAVDQAKTQDKMFQKWDEYIKS